MTLRAVLDSTLLLWVAVITRKVERQSAETMLALRVKVCAAVLTLLSAPCAPW